jgi:glycosyltransferase involved in cell wall biosynthesis
MKVAVAAYACVPGSGSEPGAGWEWARAASLRHDVWVFTESCCVEGIQEALRREPNLRMHPVAVPAPRQVAYRGEFARGERMRYAAWQQFLRRTARAVHADVGFDVAHHVTWGSDWMPAGLSGLRGVPFIWGSVGGTSAVPVRFWRELGGRQLAAEIARGVICGSGRVVFGGRLARRAAIVLVANPDVARRFHKAAPRVEPQIALHLDELPPPRTEPADTAGRSRRAVYAGRLLAWKGVQLAVAALARREAQDWTLDVYGRGPYEAAVRKACERFGVADRVALHGARPRDEVLDALATCDALLFPSMHDSAGWIVAEALALGRPVVCLDAGGPAMQVGDGRGVRVPTKGDVVGALATGLQEMPGPLPRDRRYDVGRLPDLLDQLYRDAVGTSVLPAEGHRSTGGL